MPLYIKICPICLKRFETKRIGTVFCPEKKCKNRARSIPSQLMQELLEKCNKGMQVIPTLPKSVVELLKQIADATNAVNANSGVTGISLAEQQTIISEISKIKDQREREIVVDNVKYITTNDQANGNSDGFAQPQVEQHTLPEKVNGQQKRTGLRKLGGH